MPASTAIRWAQDIAGADASRVGAAAVGVDCDFDRGLSDWLQRNTIRDGRTSITAALTVAAQLSRSNVRPGGGDTGAYFSALMTAGLVDATLARVIEPHLDAHAILHQAGMPSVLTELGANDASTWGVFAAASSSHRLAARCDAGKWRLDGTKPWCSLATTLSHALITAQVCDGGTRLFAIRLDPDRVTPLPGQWVSRGLADVDSTGIRIDRLPAIPVGDVAWYLGRAGFSWGAIGVASVWFGIARGLYDRLADELDRRAADQIALAQIGTVDSGLFAAHTCLRHAAAEIDAGRATGRAGDLLSLRVRSVVARSAEKTLAVVERALGPGPMTSDECYARRLADLRVYLRQHHAERDMLRLGEVRRALDS